MACLNILQVLITLIIGILEQFMCISQCFIYFSINRALFELHNVASECPCFIRKNKFNL